MSSDNHIEIATKTGYARVTLNRGVLLCFFYVGDGEKSFSSVEFAVRNEKAILDRGWNLKFLVWLIGTYEPKFTKYE